MRSLSEAERDAAKAEADFGKGVEQGKNGESCGLS